MTQEPTKDGGLQKLNRGLNNFFFRRRPRRQTPAQRYLERKKDALRKRAFGSRLDGNFHEEQNETQ